MKVVSGLPVLLPIVLFAYWMPSVDRQVAAAGYVVKDLYTVEAPPDTIGNNAGLITLFSTAPGGEVVGDDNTGNKKAVVFDPSNPHGVILSSADLAGHVNATDGTQQVGFQGVVAALWTGTPSSFVDLNPSSWAFSAAIATSGGEQVGYGIMPPANFSHALLWSGTAASFVDLNPAGFNNSFALGVGGGEQINDF
jgi:hypothetical protein